MSGYSYRRLADRKWWIAIVVGSLGCEYSLMLITSDELELSRMKGATSLRFDRETTGSNKHSAQQRQRRLVAAR